ncbi:hypothetical protein RSOLAG22IIIB_10916 [Rhizoctonia solani]|uniref:Uncharacterized protein n=1 Tax=Rhizoctonia solani TaxID=456999 RepID=A0A0K6G613_9AGAM|nr:hypothetical protein RSOLAG22IIIB_10916 [Rhizoctonia solani]
MADKHKSRKQKVVPPAAPRVHASSVKSSNHAQAQSVSDLTREQTPSSGMSTLSTGAYPTPNPTIRKNMSRAESAEPRSNRLPSLDLRASELFRIGSDDARISKQAPRKIKRNKPVLPSESSGSDDNESVGAKGKSKEPLGFNSSFEDGGSDEDEDADKGLKNDDEDEGGGLDEDEGSNEDAGPSTTKSDVKASAKKGSRVQAHNRKAQRGHALTIMLDMTALNQAQEAAKREFPHDESGNRIHFVDNILHPHLEQEFKPEWDVWGKSALSSHLIQRHRSHAPLCFTHIHQTWRSLHRLRIRPGSPAALPAQWATYVLANGNQIPPPPQFRSAYGQDVGAQRAFMNIPIDPDPTNAPFHSPHPNAMPPPPVMTRATPELPEVDPVPPGKTTNGGGKADKGGTKTASPRKKRKSKKSKEIIEDDEEDDADEAIAGPSRLQRNAGHPCSLRLNFKGA